MTPEQKKHFDFVLLYMRQLNVRPKTFDVIEAAYRSGYEAKSDGITGPGQFEFGKLGMKNPLGVAHDWLYFMGSKQPFLPHAVKWRTSETRAKLWADNWFRGAMFDFGYWMFAGLYWVALRLFAFRAWRAHRSRKHPVPINTLPDVR